MKPTRAQIEVAAKALAAETIEPKNSSWDELPEYLKQNCLREATIVLTAAAAAVGEPAWPSDELINGLVQSATEEDSRTIAEVGGPSNVMMNEHIKMLGDIEGGTIERCAQVVDELGKEDPYNDYVISAHIGCAAAIRALKVQSDEETELRSIKNATIERCARVAEGFGEKWASYQHEAEEIAAAIRSLKDK